MLVSKNAFLDTRNQNLSMLLSKDLLSALRCDILKGKYARGFKLTEQRLCSDYKVSRTPVREAIYKLEAEGLIETVPNKGAFVIGVSGQDIRDMFALRKLNEVQAVKWAIERITDDELDTLEETFEFMKFYTQKNDVEKMFNINMNFHQIIYIASHNTILRNILSSYQLYLKFTNQEFSGSDSRLAALLSEHQEIFNAFKTKDIDAGADAMSKHLDNSLKRYYNIQG